MKKEEIEILVSLRQKTIEKYKRLKDYRSNKNAIMKEYDHAKALHEIVVEIDKALKDHVNFSDQN